VEEVEVGPLGFLPPLKRRELKEKGETPLGFVKDQKRGTFMEGNGNPQKRSSSGTRRGLSSGGEGTGERI